jgi:Cys-tRNA(Pro)/Cys-tRNA(Cys) deacylase
MSKKTNAVRMVEQAGIAFDLLVYTYEDDNLNVANIAEKNQLDLSSIYKTLVLEGDSTGIVVAVIPGDKALLTKPLAAASGNRRVQLLPAQDLLRHTGYIRGGCSPIGMKKSYPVFVDESARNLEKIYVNAGKKGLLIRLSPEALAELCAAQWIRLTEA